MSKIFTYVIVIISLFAVSCFASLEDKLEKNLKSNFEKRGMKNIQLKVTKFTELKEVKGYYFVKVQIFDGQNNKNVDQYLFTDGENFIPDIIGLKNNTSLIKDMAFDYENVSVDVSKLTFIGGTKGAKNYIVEVSDFECPYCRKANEYVRDKIKNRKDVAVYIMHLPLSIHKKARLYAKILEAGVKFNKSFAEDLYGGKYDSKNDHDLIDVFAKMSGKEAEFKKMVNSPELDKIIKAQEDIAAKMGIQATPVIFMNGKKIEGFNPPLIDRGLSLFK